MQCGIQLKVKDNKVIGFEPWEEFPVNQGKLCPKGVKRYMQNGHPDRLVAPLIRTDEGFCATNWYEALNETVRKVSAGRWSEEFLAVLEGSPTAEREEESGKRGRRNAEIVTLRAFKRR